jgi:thiol-disulfide isomerase/thioredoxin
MENNNNLNWKKYVIVLFITAGIFATAFYLSNYVGNKKIEQLKTIQDQISIDVLSSETQFSLLSELSCKNISDSVFSDELSELGSKLSWSQDNLGNTAEVSYLQKYYSLLEIKDYLLNKQISSRCGTKAAFILYFYTNPTNCTLCNDEATVLSALRTKYPNLRVYSFDYSTDLSAVTSMLQIYKIKDTALPALVIDDNVLTGFHSIDELDSLVQNSFKLTTPVVAPVTKKQ